MAKKKHTEVNKDVVNLQHKPAEVVNVADISEDWLKIYGANVNIARMSPQLIDGLKPVAKRALYGMHTNPNKGLVSRKVLRCMADALAYHPHGDGSIGDVIYTMGSTWLQNIMYIDPQGNYGNVRGDDAAAPRYTEAKISKAANWIFFSDMKDSNVPMRPSYDGDNMEPDYLPARIPTILCNPQFSGIGIGLATNIPPFNPGEVCQATIKLIKNPKANIMLIPDSPSGCDIVDTGMFEGLNKDGDDVTLTMQASYDIDYMSNVITITSLPFHIGSDQVVSAVVNLRKTEKEKDPTKGFNGLIDIHDNSAEDRVELKFLLKKDVNPDEFIGLLLKKKTNLKKTYPVEIRCIEDLQSRVFGTKELLLEWIDYRRECVRAIYNKKLMEALSEHHMNEVFLFVLNGENLKKTIKIAKESEDKASMEQAFIDAYGITSLQAKTLSNMRTYQYSKKAYEEYKEAKKNLEKDIKDYTAIIEDDNAVDEVIIDQLKFAIKNFCGPRRSQVIKAGKLKEKIPNTKHIIGISKDGYIKKLNIDQSISIGTVGNTSQVIVTLISNRDNLLIFDSEGRITRVGVSSIPDMDIDDTGVDLTRYFKSKGTPISIINESDLDSDCGDIILVTENGIGKRVKMSEFAKIKDFKESITLTEGDSLIAAIPAGDEEFIIYTNFGDGIRLRSTDIKRQSKDAKGLKLITLRSNEKVAGIDFLEKGCDKILYITSAGRLKMTEGRLLPLMNRKDEPLSLIGLDPNEYLIGVGFVSPEDTVVVYRKKGTPVEIPLKNVAVTTRVAKAEKMVKTPSGDMVTGFKVKRKQK
jgi:DNA gyrase subunit A